MNVLRIYITSMELGLRVGRLILDYMHCLIISLVQQPVGILFSSGPSRVD